MKLNGKIKITSLEMVLYFFVIISVFIFNETFRLGLLKSYGSLGLLNVVYLLASLVLIIGHIWLGKMYKSLYCSTIVLFLIITNAFLLNKSLGHYVLLISCLIIPLFFISILIETFNVAKVYKMFLTIFNIVIIALLVFGMVDYIMDKELQLFLARNWAYEELGFLILSEYKTGVYRMYSFLGHPLYNAYLFLLFFCFNNIYNIYIKKNLNIYLVVIITLLGLLLSGSKAALIIGILLILLFVKAPKRKVIYYLAIGILFYFAFKSMLFQDNLLKRYQVGHSIGDQSSGRNMLIVELIQGDYESPHFLYGGGQGYSRTISRNIGMEIRNFEYPIIMFAYDYGILTTLLIYYIILIFPLTRFIHNKDYFLLVHFLSIFIYINTNNGLNNFSDTMASLCFVFMLMINLSELDEPNEIDDSIE